MAKSVLQYWSQAAQWEGHEDRGDRVHDVGREKEAVELILPDEDVDWTAKFATQINYLFNVRLNSLSLGFQLANIRPWPNPTKIFSVNFTPRYIEAF